MTPAERARPPIYSFKNGLAFGGTKNSKESNQGEAPMSRIRSKLTFANVTSMIALLVALSGSAYAVNTIRSSDIQDNQVKSVDVRDDDLKGGGLVGKDIKESTLGKVPNANKLDGRDVTAWNSSRVIDAFGPLPVEGTYTSKGGTLFVSAAGSGRYNGMNGGPFGADVLIDGQVVAVLQTYWPCCQDTGLRRTFVPEFAVIDTLPPGPHTIRIEAKHSGNAGCSEDSPPGTWYCTGTDSTDVFHVAIMEIPSS